MNTFVTRSSPAIKALAGEGKCDFYTPCILCTEVVREGSRRFAVVACVSSVCTESQTRVSGQMRACPAINTCKRLDERPFQAASNACTSGDERVYQQ